jgi:hypothetical protein
MTPKVRKSGNETIGESLRFCEQLICMAVAKLIIRYNAPSFGLSDLLTFGLKTITISFQSAY